MVPAVLGKGFVWNVAGEEGESVTVASEMVPALQTSPHAPAWAVARRGPRRPQATCPRCDSFAHGAARFPGSARRLPSSCTVRPSVRPRQPAAPGKAGACPSRSRAVPAPGTAPGPRPGLETPVGLGGAGASGSGREASPLSSACREGRSLHHQGHRPHLELSAVTQLSPGPREAV